MSDNQVLLQVLECINTHIPNDSQIVITQPEELQCFDLHLYLDSLDRISLGAELESEFGIELTDQNVLSWSNFKDVYDSVTDLVA